MKRARLYIFSGLPATGKSTLAKELVKYISATYIRIDSIEQGLRDICDFKNIGGEGYRLSYRIASDNLKQGNDVVADSVNPLELTRREWNEVATSLNADYFNIEVICSDQNEHRERVENREVDIVNLILPTWEKVLKRDYHAWTMSRIQIDTSGKDISESVKELLIALQLLK